MKKFYTLLSAALLATGLISAASLKDINKLANVNPSDAQLSYSLAGKSGMKMKSVAPRIKDPNEKGVNLAGDWIFSCVDEAGESEDYYGVTTIVAGENENEYIIKNLLAGYVANQTNDIKATVSKELIGTQSYYVLQFELTPVLVSAQGNDYRLYLYAYDEGDEEYPAGYYFYSQSAIAFVVIEDEDGSMVLANAFTMQDAQRQVYPGGMFFGYQRTDGWYGGTALMPYIYPTSATLTAGFYDFNEKKYVDASCRVFADYNQDSKQIVFLNFAGSPNVIVGQVSADMASVTLTNQVFASYPITQDGSGDYKPYVLTTILESGEVSETNVMNGDVTLNAANTPSLVTFPGEVGAYNKEGDIFLGIWKDITITYDSDNQGGVDNVIADSDVNAPVEYFNLQGMRVANPEAGQLVIKRQGKAVSKIVVR